MFKRVDRRRKRKEIEESLGLDDDERGVFGLHDTDSSESESDASESASTSSSATSSDGRRIKLKNKRKRYASSSSNEESSENEDDELEPVTDDEEDEDGNSEHGTTPLLTIASALQEPVRLICPDPEAWVCAFCPGKILKHAAMVKVHEASRIHRGRFKRIQELAIEFSPGDDIQSVLAKSATETQPDADGATLSRRAERRRAKQKAKQANLKERRKKIKEKKVAAMAAAKAKKETKTTEKEPVTGRFSDKEEATQASKRIKVESSKPLRKSKKTFQTGPRRMPSKTSRKNKGAT